MAGLLYSGSPDGHEDLLQARARLELDTIRRYVVIPPPSHGGLTQLSIRGRPRELDRVRDPWGQPYRSDVALGIAFTLGRDGLPGGQGPDEDAWIAFRPRLQLASVAVPVSVNNPSARADRVLIRFTKSYHPAALRSPGVTRALVIAENTDYWREAALQWSALEDRFPGVWHVDPDASSPAAGSLVLVSTGGSDCPIVPSELWFDLAQGQQVFQVTRTAPGATGPASADDFLPTGFEETFGIPAESGRGVPVRFEP